MKPEKTKHLLTDKERDTVLKMLMCGVPLSEVADIMKVSTSTISYIRQAHNACINKDWSTLQKLSTTSRPIVDWAMKVTGTDRVFIETFGEPATQRENKSDTTPVTNTITREDFLKLSNTLQDICYLLTEIRDSLK